MAKPKRANLSLLLLFLGVAVGLRAQSSTPTCVVPGVEAGGPIFTGTVMATQPATQNAPMGSVTLTVDRYLRGSHFSSDLITLPVDWADGPSKPWKLRPPIWYEATLRPGERLAIILVEVQNNTVPSCVIDLSSHTDLLPMIERMVVLNSVEGSAKIAGMEAALSDDSPTVRALAIDYLDSPEVRDPAVRQHVFEHFKPIALDTKSPQRVEALEAIKWSYDSFAKSTGLNYQILSFMADRIGDSDPRVQSISLQFIHSKLFGGGLNRPDPKKIRLVNRDAVLQQLKREAAGGPLSQHAVKVLQALSAE